MEQKNHKQGNFYYQNIELPQNLINEVKKHFSDPKYLNRAYIVLNFLFEKILEDNKMGINKTKKKYYPIFSGTKKEVTPDPYYSVWNVLVNNNIIQESINEDGTRYRTNKECKKLRINPNLLNGNMQQIQIKEFIKNKKLEEYTYNVILNKLKLNIPKGDTIESLVQKNQDEIKNIVTQDTKIYANKKAIKIKDKKYEMKGEEDFEIEKNKIIEEVTQKRCLSYINTLKKIQKLDINFPTIDKTVFRLHSYVTSLPKILLKYFTFDNDNIIESDGANFQLLLLALYLENPSNPTLHEYLNLDRFLPNSSNQFQNNWLYDLKTKPDVLEFIKLCKNGTLYKKLENELNKEKQEIKNLTFKLFYGSIQYDNNSLIFSKFKKSYPNIIKIIDNLKQYYIYIFKNTNNKQLLKLTQTKSKFKAGSDYLSIGLTRCESEIFIKTIYKKISQKNLISLTKHDCILYKETDQDKINEIIQKEFNKLLGKNNFTLKTKLITDKSLFQ